MKQYEEIVNMRDSENNITGFIMHDYAANKFFYADEKELKRMCQQDLVRYLAYDSYSDSLAPYMTNEEIAGLGKLYTPMSTINSIEEYFANDPTIHERYRDYVGGNEFILAVPTVSIKQFPVGVTTPFILVGSQELIDNFISSLSAFKGLCKKVKNCWSFTVNKIIIETLEESHILNKVLFCTEFMGVTNTPSYSELVSRGAISRSLFRKEPKDTELAELRAYCAGITSRNLTRFKGFTSSMDLF